MTSNTETTGIAFVDSAPTPCAVNFAPGSSTTDNGTPTNFAGRIMGYCRSAAHVGRQQLAMVRPWDEFLNRDRLSSPEGVTKAFTRLSRNVNHFYHNYVVLALAGSSFVLLINPLFSLCMLFCLASWCYVRKQHTDAAGTDVRHLRIGAYEITFTRAYICIVLFGIIMFYLFNGSSVIFWLAASSIGLVVAHGTLHKNTEEDNGPFV
ncbi:putative PRA1 family protein [Trypanosoma vivax]|nr:putative PRA1 family protein [Trypanosoma vivax]